MGQFHWDPDTYVEIVRAEVPDYDRVQDEVARATEGVDARRVLELGTGTGVTSRRVLERHPQRAADRRRLQRAHARRGRPARAPTCACRTCATALPEGPFDLVFSALAIHHLDGPGKADLFARVAAVLAPGGRFVLADVVVPEDPADVVTPLDAGLRPARDRARPARLDGRRRAARPRELAGARPGGAGRPTARALGDRAAKPRLSSCVACLPGSGECRSTTPRRRPLRRAAATRQRPAASV